MIRLLIADDHPVVREGLKRLAAECPDMQVVGEAEDGDGVAALLDTQADVLLLDLSMPGPGFLETLQRVQKQRPGLRVLVLSVHPEDQFAVRALRAGAAGYLTKDHSPQELLGAIRRVYSGGRYVSPALADKLVFALGSGAERPPHAALSDREYHVLCMAAMGKTVKEIAAELSLSPKTVSTYRRRILEKLRLSTHAEAVRYAIREGLVD